MIAARWGAESDPLVVKNVVVVVKNGEVHFF